ncbi:MAG: hypothetical protein ACLRSW_09615 [Christensenellaceae bacterium]
MKIRKIFLRRQHCRSHFREWFPYFPSGPSLRSAATEVSSDGYKELESVDSVVQPASTIFELRETADLSKVKKLRVNIVLAAVDKALNVVYGSESSVRSRNL